MIGSCITAPYSSSSIHTGSEKHLTEIHSTKSLCIAFYNVENLFDCKDDPGIDDEEFTPTGKQHWTPEKYAKKISNIAKVIRAMNNGDGADIVGFAEVENKGVLEDLIADPQLKKFNYGIAHHDSPDKRGIDVAAIYKKNACTVIGRKAFYVDISHYEKRPTRDILLVTGLAGKDTLYFFLNHWPSRREGKEISEPKRIIAATVLKKAVDSLLHANPKAKILITGDFNDNPTDKSIAQILKAVKSVNTTSNTLYDCDYNFDLRRGEGTEFYKGQWSRFIQIIVSSSLIENRLSLEGGFDDVHIFKPGWLLISDPASRQMIPMRTFEDNGVMGFSDHLPVYIMIGK